MPGYTQRGRAAASGQSAGSIDQGAVPTPAPHDHPEDNQMPGTPRSTDQPADQYITSENTPSMDRFTPGVPPMDNPGDYSKKFA
ncbi:MAG TPA: hypothetical protein EYQ82_07640 [Dehalococcoidia bacterium]|jgi:hypothetical protein|nr:hypothetical protein [Dehalococcoidia bacterium]HIM30855.1 hypothetical protein [Planctomycetota bacterium]